MAAFSVIASIFGLLLQLSALGSLASADQFDDCTTEGEVRLADGNTTTEGRVEICVEEVWSTICDDRWTLTEAEVVCRQLNLTTDYAVAMPLIAGGSGRLRFAGLDCTGHESYLVNCSIIDVNTCYRAEVAGVRCPAVPECDETDIRLVNGRTSDSGHVQICLRGHWGSVCDDRWDTRGATVVCRQLGYDGLSYPLLSHESDNPLNFHLDDVHCSGNESKLSECDHLGVGVHDCRWEFEEAGVVCTNATCDNGAVHLVGSDDVSRGRVEYCYKGSWYSVCASDWNEEKTEVVCETLGYDIDNYVSVVSNFGRGNNPILPRSIHCTTDDATLSNCTTTDLNVSQCQHVAGAICEAPCLSNGCDSCSSSTCIVRSSGCSCYSDCYLYGYCCPDVAHVENCTVQECETGEIRLVGGVTNSTGRLELCANGMWGKVCNRAEYWGPDNARVVCRQLGFSEDGAYVFDDASVFGVSGRDAIVGEVHCVGTEPELLECSHSSFGDHFCYSAPLLDIAISCYDEKTSCEEGDVRLRDGTDPSNGRVEICQHRTWGAVCSDKWTDSEARVVCSQLSYDPEDARAMEGFGNNKSVPVFFDKVACNGTENHVSMCSNAAVTGECSIAGVTCGKSSSNGRCPGKQQENTVTKEERFGVCEAYGINVGEADAEVCTQVLTLGADFVYISHSRGSQNDITTLLNSNIRNISNILATHDKDCVELVYRVLCHYYLPPCGNITHHPLPPTSLCQEECTHVQSMCEATWQTAALAFNPDTFINCNDTAHLLFPLPNCCTGAGIMKSTAPTILIESTVVSEPTAALKPTVVLEPTVVSEANTGGVSGGAVAGIVLGVLVFIILAAAAPVVAVLLVIRYKQMHRRKLMERMQMDILAMPSHDQVVLNSVENHMYEAGSAHNGEFEPEHKTLLIGTSIADPNPYSVPQPKGAANTVSSSLHVYENRTRIPSQYMRELSIGKFVVKQEDITLLDNIGEGEFGIVYRAKLNHHGRPSREVAVKTLKGEFDQLEVDKFVEESLKMSRFKHSHVMGLIAVCLDSGSAPFIIMPYMANGSLLRYLKKERKNIVLSDDEDEDEVKTVCKRLTVMCSQIASGMEYLAAEKYIHRDLAARNCMIDTHFLIKITDFGLSEDVFVRNYFRQGSAGEVVKLPVKWMSPESLSDGHFSEKSDVWSYGVTMWEIFSGGKAPFPGTDPLTLMQRLEEGERMPKPYNTACTDEMYAMMRNCWEVVPENRPTFKELYTDISKYIEKMAGYLEMGFNPFAAGEGAKSAVHVGGEEIEAECGVAIQVIPASVQMNGAHTTFTDNTD